MLRLSLPLLFAEYVPKWASTHIDTSHDPHSVTRNFRRTEQAAAAADVEKANKGFFYLPRLDYDVGNGIAPLMSKRQFDVQYHIFHKGAVKRLNTHTMGSELEGHNLDVVIRKTSFDASRAVIHAAAAEHFNYCFWYKSLRPWGTPVPLRLREDFQLQYSGNGTVDAVEEVQRRFLTAALSLQSRPGWVYLVWTGKSFDIIDFQHGTCPIGSDLIPLLALNVHESSMYFDYPASSGTEVERMEQYVRNYFKTCNWGLAERYYLGVMQAAR